MLLVQRNAAISTPQLYSGVLRCDVVGAVNSWLARAGRSILRPASMNGAKETPVGDENSQSQTDFRRLKAQQRTISCAAVV